MIGSGVRLSESRSMISKVLTVWPEPSGAKATQVKLHA